MGGAREWRCAPRHASMQVALSGRAGVVGIVPVSVLLPVHPSGFAHWSFGFCSAWLAPGCVRWSIGVDPVDPIVPPRSADRATPGPPPLSPPP